MKKVKEKNCKHQSGDFLTHGSFTQKGLNCLTLSIYDLPSIPNDTINGSAASHSNFSEEQSLFLYFEKAFPLGVIRC